MTKPHFNSKFGEATEIVPFRIPKSKKEEIKKKVYKILQQYQRKG